MRRELPADSELLEEILDDADLLGGNCNGETKRAFNSFVDSLKFDGTAQPYTGHEKEAY